MRTVLLAVLVLASQSAFAVVQKDAAKCRDSPLFTRMPDSWIHSCDEKVFDAHEFLVAKGKKERVEGRKVVLRYYPQADAKARPSELQILRNFENAVTKAGGKVVYSEKTRATLTLTQDGKELWVDVTAEFTGKYGLTIIEKEAMKQDIVADAAAFANDLKATGHVAVYGIYFDSGKADLKPESTQALSCSRPTRGSSCGWWGTPTRRAAPSRTWTSRAAAPPPSSRRSPPRTRWPRPASRPSATGRTRPSPPTRRTRAARRIAASSW